MAIMFPVSLLSLAFTLLTPHIHVAIAIPFPDYISHEGGSRPISTRLVQDIVTQLNLVQSVEKGYYIETFEDPDHTSTGRNVSTAIYYLLEGSAGPSYWHRVDATEVWHHYAGAPLELSLSRNGSAPVTHKVLGADIFSGQQPQIVIPKRVWQRARSLGMWTLVGTTMAPGFDESGFELAPPDWQPNGV